MTDEPRVDYEDKAPDGALWVCAACGKATKDRLTMEGADQGWDASCTINSVLVTEASIKRDKKGRIYQATAYKGELNGKSN